MMLCVQPEWPAVRMSAERISLVLCLSILVDMNEEYLVLRVNDLEVLLSPV